MATDFERKDQAGGLTLKLYRGEGVGLLAFDLDPALATDDFVGFSVETRPPGAASWRPLHNRLHFDYPPGPNPPHAFSSVSAPFQKFRWMHFPAEVRDGEYRYRATARYMRPDGSLAAGASVEGAISLAPETIAGVVNVGFTRGFASSQAYADRFNNERRILPPLGSPARANLTHDMAPFEKHYDWLGFEARRLLVQTLAEAQADATLSVDALIYECKEPDVLARLESLGPRLRAIIDDHGENAAADSAESIAAERLLAAGALVKRMHFGRQQHNKILVLRRGGTALKVLTGSTNFSLRGLYIQANNLLLFSDAGVATLYGELFDAYWSAPSRFRQSPLSREWHLRRDLPGSRLSFTFSPRSDAEVSLGPVAQAIEGAESSVLYAVVFLNQLSGRVREALDELMQRSLFSYGVAQRTQGLTVAKPDGSRGLLPFAYLGTKAPPPFRAEWHGNTVERSNMVHHKFVVTDFNGAHPKVFTGSSNLAAGGEKANGDNLICIEDRKVAIAYAIEALRMFDHFHFRVSMKEGDAANTVIRLARPPAAGDKPWFAPYYRPGHVKERDRLLFAT